MADPKLIHTLPENLPDAPNELEQLIANHEHQSSPLKAGTEAKIIWHNKNRKEKTPFSIVYLHGFKGSPDGGTPIHQMVAQITGCNLYLPRLAEHGKKTDRPLANLTLPSLIQSAVDAYRVGRKIGEKVILMGTSLGGGLSLYLAGTRPRSVAATVLYSPLIHIYGRYSLLLEHAAGRQILKMILGENHIVHPKSTSSAEIHRIWDTAFHLNGAFAVGKFAQQKMTGELFNKVTCPVFTGYYYKNRLHFDRTVSVPAIKRMMPQLGTPRSKKTLQCFPGANAHILTNLLVSDAAKEIFRSTIRFLSQHLPLSIPDLKQTVTP